METILSCIKKVILIRKSILTLTLPILMATAGDNLAADKFSLDALLDRLNPQVRTEQTYHQDESQKQDYSKILEKISIEKNRFRDLYSKSTSSIQKKEILSKARGFVIDELIDNIFPSWYGTRWDFNGATQTPKQGNIACGYFVTTTLRDVGFNLDRSRLARQPSEHIIKNLTGLENIKRYSNKNIQDVNKYILESGEGIYIVGLDCHVGFIVNDGENVNFVHSSYYNPPLSVVSEPIDSFNPLAHSKYRVIGKILDDSMIEKWITGKHIELKFDYFRK
jgi:hypothetical protein